MDTLPHLRLSVEAPTAGRPFPVISVLPVAPPASRHRLAISDAAENFFDEHPLRYEQEIKEYLGTWAADIMYQLEHETGDGLARALECHRKDWIARLERVAAERGAT